MKKLIPIIMLFATLSIMTASESPYYSPQNHKIFEKLLGEWNVIYANQSNKGAPAGGRGTAKSKLNLGKTILELESELSFDLGDIKSTFLIGYDKNKSQYYFLTYNNAGETPALLWGEYLAENKIFEFKSYIGSIPKTGDTRLIIEMTRDDKFILKSFVFENGTEKPTLDMGFIKK